MNYFNEIKLLSECHEDILAIKQVLSVTPKEADRNALSEALASNREVKSYYRHLLN